MIPTIPSVEVGSLSAPLPNESHFIGSSSGIFFANTVHQAFAISKSTLPLSIDSVTERQNYPSIDSCIAGDEEQVTASSPNNATQSPPQDCTEIANSSSYGIPRCGLGLPPSIGLAKRLITVYFEVWHPLFPFLHGPTFLQEIEAFYAGEFNAQGQDSSQLLRNTSRAVVFQSIFNLVGLNRPDIGLRPECRIQSPSSLFSVMSSVFYRHDIASLQALLAAQLYLMSAMSLHAASTLGAILLRSIFHAGLHRCPFRYPQLSQHDRDMRKRIFWVAYSIDRYLSQSLGHPLGIQDSDIDVCVPGANELHNTDKSAAQVSRNAASHLPRSHHNSNVIRSGDSSETSGTAGQNINHSIGQFDLGSVVHSSQPTYYGEAVFASYVKYSRITGQAIELFHKSIHTRSVEPNDILTLTSDVLAWWNSLPQGLQGHQYIISLDVNDEVTRSLGSFFAMNYQQLILLINRPFLSMDSSTPQFRSSLQTCISASRMIISTIKQRYAQQSFLFWPGFLSGLWMSGLILAFACELRDYPFSKARREIQTCLDLLQALGEKWATAMHCHSVLSVFLNDLRIRFDKSSNLATSQPLDSRKNKMGNNGCLTSSTSGHVETPKRRKVDSNSSIDKDSIESNQQNLHGQNYRIRNGNSMIGSTTYREYDQSSDPQWVQSSASTGLIPEMEDFFGHLSWESMFPSDGSETYLWPIGSYTEPEAGTL